MKKINLTLVTAILLLVCGRSHAQSEIPDNKGKEFWLMFNENVPPYELSLFLTGDIATSGHST